MSWPLVEIGKCGTIVSGSTPKTIVEEYWNGTILWVTPKDLSELDNIYISTTNKTITEKGLKSCSTNLLPANSVLFSSRAPIGLIAINTVPMCSNQGFKSIIPDRNKVDSAYLYYILKSKKSYLNSIGNGATFKELSKSIFSKVEIPLPPLDDQIRIATVLTRAEKLIAKRKESIKALDEFLKSTFLEMFGDPVRNEKGWEKKELKFFGRIITGNTPPRNNDDNYSSKFMEWIKTDNIVAKSTYLTAATEYLSEKGLDKARFVTPGALLVACIAGSVESIGRAAIANRRVSFNQQINAIQPNEKINPLFLYWLFKISKLYIQSHATKGMKKILTKGDFEKITMIRPPLALQNQFAAIVEKAESLKSKYTQSLTELENLYGSLSQRAFKGELDLSRVPLEKEMQAC